MLLAGRNTIGKSALIVIGCPLATSMDFIVARTFGRLVGGGRLSGLPLSLLAKLVIALPGNRSGAVVPVFPSRFSFWRQQLLVRVLNFLKFLFVAAQVRVVGRGKLAVCAMDFLIRRVGRDIKNSGELIQ